MKLIFRYDWCEEHVASGVVTIPFEYSSKEDFQYLLLQKIEEYYANAEKEHGKQYVKKYPEQFNQGYVKVFDHYVSVESLSDIEGCVYTVDEWFEVYKEKMRD